MSIDIPFVDFRANSYSVEKRDKANFVIISDSYTMVQLSGRATWILIKLIYPIYLFTYIESLFDFSYYTHCTCKFDLVT